MIPADYSYDRDRPLVKPVINLNFVILGVPPL